jgi:hypothetical protein
MSLRNIAKFIQLRSISKSRFNKINTNSDITPPNNLVIVTFEHFFARMRFCVYQGITTLNNSTYQNRLTHEWLQLISSKGGCIT